MYGLAVYSLKVGACLALFYLFFKLLLSRETLHRFNRMVVLGTMLLSFALPLCVITVTREYPVPPELFGLPDIPTAFAETGPAPEAEPFSWELLVGCLYLTGVLAMLVATGLSVWRVMRLVRSGRREKLANGFVLVRLPQAATPFSWWRYIVLSEEDYAGCGREIITHETAHLRLHHSWDLLAADVAGCLQWFNPAMWLLRRELRAIHEYEADEAVLNSGADARQYQILLIKKAAGGRWYSVANSFNHSKLKNRITMMLQKRSSRWAGAKALFAMPLAGLALGAFAETVYVPVFEDKSKQNSATEELFAEKSDKQAATRVDKTSGGPDNTAPAGVKIKDDTVAVHYETDAPDLKEKLAEAKKKMSADFSNDEWKQKWEELERYFQSDEWKQQWEELKKNSAELEKMSAANDAYFQSDEWKQKSEELERYFQSDEWKQKWEELKKNSAELKKKSAELEKMSAAIDAYFQSDEWKQKSEELERYFQSDEWKQQSLNSRFGTEPTDDTRFIVIDGKQATEADLKALDARRIRSVDIKKDKQADGSVASTVSVTTGDNDTRFIVDKQADGSVASTLTVTTKDKKRNKADKH